MTSGTPMPDDVSCELIAAAAGTIRLRIGDAEHDVTLRGVTLPPESSAAITALLTRLRRAGLPARCRLDAAGRAADVRYVAWRDKSGDVWENLAATLLDAGLARPA